MHATIRVGMLIRPIVTLVTLSVIGLAALRSSEVSNAPVGGSGVSDVATFGAVVTRLRSGEPYYHAYGEELRQHDYPTQNVFNWRTPLLLRMVSGLGDETARVVLITMGIILCFATFTVLHPAHVAGSAGMLQLGAVVTISTSSAVMLGEAWSGVFIGLSLCAYAARRSQLAIVTGVLALFMRELAGLYCIVCTISAIVDRRWREAWGWVAGAALYAAYYGWHLISLRAEQLPTDLAHQFAWVQFGGLPFLISTVRWHGWLMMIPQPFTVVALVLVLAGVVNDRAPKQLRLAGAGYAALFLVAGQRFNDYWGLLAWPTWALACGYGVQTILESLKAVRLAVARAQ